MNKLTFILIFVLAVLVSVVFAVESRAEMPGAPEGITEGAEDMPVYQFPVVKPEINLYTGFNSVHLDGSHNAAEYQYLKDSIILGGEMRVITYPHRLHLDFNILNEKDYDADISYAYSDVVLFRFQNTTLFHNLDNIRLSSGSVNSVDGPGEHYGIKSSMNNFVLRLKAPDFPAHFYISGNYFEKNGTRQQISLLGSANFNNRVRTTRERETEWTTKEVTVGVNSLLGPVEVDISHSEKRFSPGPEHVLFNEYASAGATRNAGVYPYSLNPAIKSSANTLKLHTLYSGGLVASATFTKIKKENTESGAKADYFIGSGQVMWMIMPKLTFFLKYRHKDMDIDNPETIFIIAGIPVCSSTNNSAGTYRCEIRPSISSMTDTVSGILRYRPFGGFTLTGEYSYEDVRRDNYEEWHLPRDTERNAVSLSADAKIAKNVKLMAKYTHRNISNPATNNEPEKADEGKVNLSWMPLLELNASLGYDIAKGKSDDLHIPDSSGNRVPSADRSNMKRQRLTANLSYLLLKDVSLTFTYAYIDNKVEQDLVYNNATGAPLTDHSIPYKEVANNYSFDAAYMPKSNFLLNAGVSHTNSKGNFYPSDLLGQSGINSFSSIKIRETVFSVLGKYTVRKIFDIGVQYRYSRFEDVLDHPDDDVNDGKAHAVLLTLRKEW